MTLLEFLTARLDEDEAAAKAWLPFGNPDAAARAHIARHDPARVLRDVERDRRIIDEHQIARNTVTAEGDFSNAPGCATCHESDGEVIAFGYCRTLRLLASVYVDHPDFRPEWHVT